MVLSNSQGHTVPFVIDPKDHDVQDFVIPPSDQITQLAEEIAEKWADVGDLIEYVDFNIDQIRDNEALADAAKNKAKFAEKTSKGYKANSEFRRALIEAVLNSAVSRGLVAEPKIKAATYTVNIQDSVGALEIKTELEAFTNTLQGHLDLCSATLMAQVLQGAPISLDDQSISKLAELSEYYVDNYGSATDKDIACFETKTTVSIAKVYTKQALKNKWLTALLAKAFKVGKGRVLSIRL